MKGKRKNLVIGITGGVGSGKSTVARMFERLGAKVISADEIAHSVLEREAVKRKVTKIWGRDILTSSGKINRKRLADKVFRKEEELRRLETIIHPPVIKKIGQELQGASAEEVMVVDAPLLLEAHLDRLCKCIVFVDAKERLRLNRLQRERGWDEEEFVRRQARQKPLNLKREKADYVINNNQDLEHAFRQVKRIWKKLGASSPPFITSVPGKKERAQGKPEVSNTLPNRKQANSRRR